MNKTQDLIYTVHKKLLADDVTMYRRLRPSTLMRMLQEISIAHTEALGAGRAKTLDKGALWVVARMKLEVESLPSYDDEITLTSWAGKTMRVLFPRYYEMRDKDGNVLLRASAIWLLMDEKSRHMVFPEAYGVEVPAPDIQPIIDLPCGVALGEQNQEKTFTVSYSQVDINGHMNNSKYIDETEDLLGAEYLKDHELRALEIEYKSEVKLGRRVTLKYTQSGDDLSLVGVVEGNPCFELVAKFAPIRR